MGIEIYLNAVWLSIPMWNTAYTHKKTNHSFSVEIQTEMLIPTPDSVPSTRSEAIFI